MIVRIWEARVVPGRIDEFCAMLTSDVVPNIGEADGFQGVEMLRSLDADDGRVLMITRWRDEEALRGYAGPMWRLRPVWAEAELVYLSRPPQVSHFAVGPGLAP